MQVSAATRDTTVHTQPPLLTLKGISKSFPGCVANDAIDLDIQRNEIHALLGQNGAGKSTLVKIIYGLLQPDDGVLAWQGSPLTVRSPAHARRLGIAMVFQHFSLFDSLTVLENIQLGLSGSRVQQTPRNLRQQVISLSERYGLPLVPDKQTYALSVGEKQRIEIVRCLLQSPQLLIMDEPTSVLTPQEIDALFTTLRKLRDEGVAILYISHKLDEIRNLCDRATILRNGRKVAVANPADESAASLARLMIGETVINDVPPVQTSESSIAGTTLRIRNLSLASEDDLAVNLQDVSFDVLPGEILGMAGVAGNGQDELVQALSGERQVAADSVKLLETSSSEASKSPALERSLGHLMPGARRKFGVCVIPEERLGHAAVPTMTLAENTLLTGFRRLPLAPLGWIRKRRVNQFAVDVTERYHVVYGDIQDPVSSLSGGNLQKFIVGREIEQQPKVLVVAQPTWGVDAGAAVHIRRKLLEIAASGVAVLVISQDLDELLSISTNILAICAGRVSAIYPRSILDTTAIGLLMGGEALDFSPDGVPTPVSNRSINTRPDHMGNSR